MRKNYTINKESKSYLANLLATENLEVQYKKTQTASFDVKNRILTLPIWKKDLSEPVTDLFVAHEVGHALYTPMSLLTKAQKQKINHSIINVVEDARIEKLIKRKYNGLKQSFIRGYRELIADNFFGTVDKDINDYLLIDRINIHFKSSHVSSNVEFSNEEMKFVEMIEKLETPDDVIKVSKLLQSYCNIEKEEKGRDQEIEFDKHDFETVDIDDLTDEEKENLEEVSSDNTNDTDEESDDQSDASTKSVKKNKEEKEEEENNENPVSTGISGKSEDLTQAISETDRNWESMKDSVLDNEAKDNEYCYIHKFKNQDEVIDDYKKVLDDFRKTTSYNLSGSNENRYDRSSNDDHAERYAEALHDAKSEYKKFVKNSMKTVMYLVKEFEMKKSAALYARASSDRTGVVDPLKLHSYKYADDIFKKITIMPDGKNHGLMLLLDWSGSMYDKILPTVEQLINLTLFCRKINVPFEVYAFTNCNSNPYAHREYDEGKKFDYKLGDLKIDSNFRLVNWASSRMNNRDFDENMFNLYYVARRFNSRGWYTNDCFDYLDYPSQYSMSSTPLNDALMLLHTLVPQFIKKYSIEKMNTILLTDGHSDRGGERYDPTIDFPRHPHNLILISKKTRKQYKLDSKSYRSQTMTDSLIENLRSETNSKMIGFYLQSRKSIELYNFQSSHGQVDEYGYLRITNEIANQLKTEWRKNKCVVTDRLKHNTVYDEHYTLSGSNMKVSDEGMATPSENAKTGELKRLFAKSRNNNLQSRVVLNRFIKQVA